MTLNKRVQKVITNLPIAFWIYVYNVMAAVIIP